MYNPTDIAVKYVKEFSGHTAALYRLIEGNNDNTFISAGGDGIIAKWDVEKEDSGTALIKVSSPVFCVCKIPGTTLIATGQLNGAIQIFDIVSQKEIIEIQTGTHAIYDLKVHADYLFAASGNGKIYIYDQDSFSLISTLNLSNKSIRCLEIMDNNIIAGCSDTLLYKIHLPAFNFHAIESGHSNSIFSLLYIKESEKLISGSRDAQMGVFDAKNLQSPPLFIPAHLNTINGIALNKFHGLLATASRDKTIRIWDAHTFTLLKSIDGKQNGHINSVNNVFWTADNKFLISCGDDRRIILWEITVKK